MKREESRSGKATKTKVKDLKAKKDPRGGAPSVSDITITKKENKGSAPLMP
jgi:hypothetical protein